MRNSMSRAWPACPQDISLQHDSIARSGPGDGRWDLPCTLDLGKDLRRHGVIQQALGRARREWRRKILCASGGDCWTVEAEQGLALAHLASRRHVLNRFYEGLGPQRDHDNAPLIELHAARRAHGFGDDVSHGRFRLDADALQFAGRHLDRHTILVLAFVDGDIVHPHWVLLRHLGDVGKPHGVAVIENLSASELSGGRFGLACAYRVEIGVLVGVNRMPRTAIRRRFRFGGIKWLALRVSVIDHRAPVTIRALGGAGIDQRQQTLVPSDAIPTNSHRNECGEN